MYVWMRSRARKGSYLSKVWSMDFWGTWESWGRYDIVVHVPSTLWPTLFVHFDLLPAAAARFPSRKIHTFRPTLHTFPPPAHPPLKAGWEKINLLSRVEGRSYPSPHPLVRPQCPSVALKLHACMQLWYGRKLFQLLMKQREKNLQSSHVW